MTSGMSESADTTERVGDQSLAGCPSQAAQGCREDVGLCLVIAWVEETYGGAKRGGGVKGAHLGRSIPEKGTLMQPIRRTVNTLACTTTH